MDKRYSALVTLIAWEMAKTAYSSGKMLSYNEQDAILTLKHLFENFRASLFETIDRQDTFYNSMYEYLDGKYN